MKKTWLLGLSTLFLFSLSFSNLSGFDKAQILSASEEFEVERGDIINVSNKILVHNEESKECEGLIIFPDGSSKKGRSFTVTMPGVYKVIYRALFGFEEVEETITYTCKRRAYDFFYDSNNVSSIDAGAYSHNTKSQIISGAILNLTSNANFVYDGVIDFSTFNPDTPFVEFIVDPSEVGEADIEKLAIRLTDVENANNFIEISVADSGPIDDDGKGCYVLAGSYNQLRTGYEGSTLHIGRFGTNVGSSFRNLLYGDLVRPCSLYLNHLEKRLDVSPIMWGTDKRIITDLDDSSIYGSSIWSGFATGKAILSIRADTMLATSGKVVVTKVAGIDLSQEYFEDVTAPTIAIDYGTQNPALIPTAVVNNTYSIFPASVKDDSDKDLSYNVSVLFEDEINHVYRDVSIENNSFVPQKVGHYQIVYKARDYFWNEATKVIDVYAVNDVETMTVEINKTFETQPIYSTFELPSVDEVVVTGGSGVSTVTRTIIKDSSGEIIEIEGNNFVPEESGEYTVSYFATDYLGNIGTKNVKLTVSNLNSPRFVGDLVLPRVLIKGHTYELPNYDAVESVDGQTRHLDSVIYVNGSQIENNTFVADSTCSVDYVAEGQTGDCRQIFSIPVIDGEDSTKQAPYFYGNFSSVIENKDSVSLIANSDASCLFASVLPYDDTSIQFETIRNKTNYSALRFKYSDSKNPAKSLTFVVNFADGIAQISGGNIIPVEFQGEQRGTNTSYLINFNNSSRAIYDIRRNVCGLVNTFDDGTPFTGFTNGVYLDIFMDAVTIESQLEIVAISNQDMGHKGFHIDIANPILLFKDKFVIEQAYQADVYIPKVEVYDVLSTASVSLTVRFPDNSTPIRNADPNNVSFKLEQFGNYILTYAVSDGAGNSASYPRRIVVYDNVAPVLTVNNTLKATYKLNETVKIPSYTVSDNLNDYTVSVFLLLPNDEERILIYDNNGEITYFLSKDNQIYNASFKVSNTSFKAEQKGRYTLRFVACDNIFNKVVQDFFFDVK